MPSLRDELERVAAVVRTITDRDVEVVIDEETATRAVYVVFSHYEAIVIESGLSLGHGQFYRIERCEWIPGQGTKCEMTWIADVRMETLPGVVKGLIDKIEGFDADLRRMMQAGE